MTQEQIDYTMTFSKEEIKMFAVKVIELGAVPNTEIPFEIAQEAIKIIEDNRKQDRYQRAMKIIGF